MNFGLLKQKNFRLYSTKAGDRTLTPAQKRKIKEEQGFRCAKCGEKKDPRYLEIHHKKEIHKYKHPMGLDVPQYSVGKKIKPKSDRRSNLQAICIKCHDKTRKRLVNKKPKTSKKKVAKKKTTRKKTTKKKAARKRTTKKRTTKKKSTRRRRPSNQFRIQPIRIPRI